MSVWAGFDVRARIVRPDPQCWALCGRPERPERSRMLRSRRRLHGRAGPHALAAVLGGREILDMLCFERCWVGTDVQDMAAYARTGGILLGQYFRARGTRRADFGRCWREERTPLSVGSASMALSGNRL